MFYQIWFTTYVITIQIDDPYAPIINGDDVIEVNKGMKGYDFNSHFEVTGFSKVVVKLNLSQVDFDHEGIYPASIEAKDASNNIAKKEFQVLILEVEQSTFFVTY